MTSEFYCSTDLAIGVEIMSQPVRLDETRSIEVTRVGDELSLKNGTVVHHGRFNINLVKATTQFVYEVEGCNAYFESGECEGQKRSIERRTILVLPDQVMSDCEVRIKAGWGISYKTGVQMTNDFILFTATASDKDQYLDSLEL